MEEQVQVQTLEECTDVDMGVVGYTVEYGEDMGDVEYVTTMEELWQFLGMDTDAYRLCRENIIRQLAVWQEVDLSEAYKQHVVVRLATK